MTKPPVPLTISRRLALGKRLAQYIGAYGLNNAQRALLLSDSRSFIQLMLGEMVIQGWLHGNAYERWRGLRQNLAVDHPEQALQAQSALAGFVAG